MKTQLINSMTSFALGTGATLVALASWLGTSDLTEIKTSVQQYVTQSEEQASALMSEYNVMVENANAEIADYQKALEKANANINQLIEKYEQDQTQASEDLTDLQEQLEAMQARLDQQYQTDMNAMIEQANIEINKANEEVAQAKVDVNTIIEGSEMTTIAGGEKTQLATGGDKTVNIISGVVGLQIESVADMGVHEVLLNGNSTAKPYQIYQFNFNDGTSHYVVELGGTYYIQQDMEQRFEYNETTYLPLATAYHKANLK